MLSSNNAKIGLIGAAIVGVTVLHYLTLSELSYEHTFLRLLYYVPLVFAGLWYGLRGTMAVCAAVIALYTPYMFIQWHGFSTQDFDRLMEGVLFTAVAVLLGILMDREKRHVKALMEAESLAAVGRAVSEIAHDMKSPLMAIGGFVNQVARHMSPDNPDRKKLDIAIKEAARLEDMVREMLEFSKPVKLVPSSVNINNMVRELLQTLSPTAAQAKISLVHNATEDLPLLNADREKIRRVLLNLITNAIQASPENEIVTISTQSNNDGILIKVTDHGAGIEEDHKESVFHPFFTTKKSGTGLGLGVAKKITEAHGGRIYFYPNNQEPGVTFVVELPLRSMD